MAYSTKRLSDEDRAYWEKKAKAAVPYTEEEADDIAFDDPRMEDDHESARFDAYMALKILAEDNELRKKDEHP
ncbi:MAG: hypothetical protein HFE44_07965 [Oscillospiraceae bacterium]|jgi:hypothetical protein|nr:hypothetical protein [Oscillospiraceae bacterium]